MWVAFACSAKATHILSAKNIIILYIESAKTVNKMTLNEPVKLTMLWTTGPCSESDFSVEKTSQVTLRHVMFAVLFKKSS